jgi:hypothetical protein
MARAGALAVERLAVQRERDPIERLQGTYQR